MGKICDSFGKKSKEKEIDRKESPITYDNKIEDNTNDQFKIKTNINEPKIETNLNNSQKPAIHKYDPKLLESIEKEPKLLESVASQQEILIQGGKPNPDYKRKEGDITDKNLDNLINNGIDQSCRISLCKSSYSNSYIDNNNNNKSVTLKENNYKTGINQLQQKLQLFASQNGKRNNINNSSKISISINGSGSVPNAYIYMPKKDDEPIPDFEKISEKIIEEDAYE